MHILLLENEEQASEKNFNAMFLSKTKPTYQNSAIF